jgi:hypothetical protein
MAKVITSAGLSEFIETGKTEEMKPARRIYLELPLSRGVCAITEPEVTGGQQLDRCIDRPDT